MLIKLLSFALFLSLNYFCCDYLSAQENPIQRDSINRVDSLGKKHGYWIEYLKPNLKITRKKEKALYYRFVRYSHGIRFDYPIVRESGIIFKVVADTLFDCTKNIRELDGTFKLYVKKGRILARECYFRLGMLIYQIDYLDDEITETHLEQTYKNIPFSYKQTVFSTSGELIREYYIVLENLKWRRVNVTSQSQNTEP
ncbi:MAG: hypothetical protein KKD31_17915 [Bacteroidetes bacterium]|nr:hypothetical protein [Bacteroidota bacterium]